MYYSIDRISDGVATLLDDENVQREIPAVQLPDGSREGDMLRCENGAYTLDEEETARRKARIRGLLDGLLGK